MPDGAVEKINGDNVYKMYNIVPGHSKCSINGDYIYYCYYEYIYYLLS